MLSSFLIAGAEPSPSEQAIGRETSERLETALLELDERDRELLVLREICGLSYAELGAKLEIGESSARSAVARAKARLAERLP
jgi:RNA polymerase sigma-70 factor (ECF subfamily)